MGSESTGVVADCAEAANGHTSNLYLYDRDTDVTYGYMKVIVWQILNSLSRIGCWWGMSLVVAIWLF